MYKYEKYDKVIRKNPLYINVIHVLLVNTVVFQGVTIWKKFIKLED